MFFFRGIKNSRLFSVFLALILTTGSFFLTGCKEEALPKDEPPLFEEMTVLETTADWLDYIGGIPIVLDTSRIRHGYMTARATDDGRKKSVQVISPGGGTAYTYFLEPGEEAVIPLTEGEGTYTVAGFQQIEGSRYGQLYEVKLDVVLDNLFYPFLYPNQYVSFSAASEACILAQELLPPDAGDLEALNAVFDYVISHIRYDPAKASTVSSGYIPDIDETLRTGRGICSDFAALTCAMLRARNIPCRLVTGYAGDVYHAWVDVYIRQPGTFLDTITLNGNTWVRADPTFYASSGDTGYILSFIGDGENYERKYFY